MQPYLHPYLLISPLPLLMGPYLDFLQRVLEGSTAILGYPLRETTDTLQVDKASEPRLGKATRPNEGPQPESASESNSKSFGFLIWAHMSVYRHKTINKQGTMFQIPVKDLGPMLDARSSVQGALLPWKTQAWRSGVPGKPGET